MPQIIGTLGLLLGIAGSRIIRGAVVSVRENMYVHAAQSIGASTFAHPVAPHPAQRHGAGDRAVHHPRRHGDPGRIGPVVPRARRAAAGADLGRAAVGQRAAPTCCRDRGSRWRRASASPSWSTPPTCSATRCAICSIRACAARDNRTKITGEETMHVSRNRWRLAAASVAATLALGTLPAFAQSEKPPKYGGTLEIGTVYVTLSALSCDPADWNWKLNHDTGADLRAAVRRRPDQDASSTAASIRSMPMPGCRPTRSAASWPRAGGGSRTRCGS